MRKLYLLLSIILLFAACGKNDSKPVPKSYSIVGKWYFTQDTIKGYTDGKNTFTLINAGSVFNRTSYTQFNEDKTGTQVFGNSTSDFRYVRNDDAIKFINLKDVLFRQNVTIKKLDDKNLVLFYERTDFQEERTIRTTQVSYYTK